MLLPLVLYIVGGSAAKWLKGVPSQLFCFSGLGLLQKGHGVCPCDPRSFSMGAVDRDERTMGVWRDT